MAKTDVVVLFHPGGSRVELDSGQTVRVEQFKARGYTSATVAPSARPQAPAPK